MNIHKICNPIRISLSSVSISLGQSSMLALIQNNQKLTCCLPELRIENSCRRPSCPFVRSCIENFLEILTDAPSLPPSSPLLLFGMLTPSLSRHQTKCKHWRENVTFVISLNQTHIPNCKQQLLLLRRFISCYTSTVLNLNSYSAVCVAYMAIQTFPCFFNLTHTTQNTTRSLGFKFISVCAHFLSPFCTPGALAIAMLLGTQFLVGGSPIPQSVGALSWSYLLSHY